MKKIEKNRGSVYCGGDSWTVLQKCITNFTPSKIIVLADNNTYKHCFPELKQRLVSNQTLHNITIPAGEAYKTIETCLHVWEQLSALGADRKSLLINLGGGVVTDLGGFVASTFKRGIEFINIPTSLLAIVDASVGGKNGVDLGHLKNQIGVIRNPLAVCIDISFLKTLPKAQIISGYAEMLKHGLIASEVYWESLKMLNFNDTKALEVAIWKSIEIKNTIVSKDPTEQGIRKTLNYGHTLGHAIESYCLENSHRNDLLHGEAIAIGMILATYISSNLLNFPTEKLNQTTSQILKHFPKVSFSKKEIDAIIELLKFDKKNIDGNINFVLLQDFEHYKIDQRVRNELIFKAFDFYKNFKH